MMRRVDLLDFTLALASLAAGVHLLAGHTRAEQDVPVDEERLREVGLDTDDLLVRVSKEMTSSWGAKMNIPDGGYRDSPPCFR